MKKSILFLIALIFLYFAVLTAGAFGSGHLDAANDTEAIQKVRWVILRAGMGEMQREWKEKSNNDVSYYGKLVCKQKS